MSETNLNQNIENLGDALQRLGDALKKRRKNKLEIDGTIQRFEFTIELYWKTLKRALEEQNIKVLTPKETLQKAFQLGWLMDEMAWLQMMKDRNETSHVYDQAVANRIYKNIKGYFPEMVYVFELLKGRSKA